MEVDLTEANPPLRVLLVDDHDIVRMGVRQLLQQLTQPVHMVDVATLPEAQVELAKAAFDLLLLDLALGSDFGLQALPRLRDMAPAMKIIVLTSLAEDLFAERALRAGANGYVMKTELGSTLLEAVGCVLAGDVYLSVRQRNEVLRRLGGGSRLARPAPAGSAHKPELSPRELEVLRLVAQGLSTRDIAETLNRSVKTIETHKMALKDKLGADSPAQLVRLALSWFGDAA